MEDELSVLEALKTFLLGLGYRVRTAATARQAKKAAAHDHPALVICDWQLQDHDSGVDVARELQNDYGASIIFTTAYPIDQLRRAADDIEVQRFLRKPISLPLLLSAIEQS